MLKPVLGVCECVHPLHPKSAPRDNGCLVSNYTPLAHCSETAAPTEREKSRVDEMRALCGQKAETKNGHTCNGGQHLE